MSKLSFALSVTVAVALILPMSYGCDARRAVMMRDGGSADSAPPSNMCTPGVAGFRCEGNLAVECLASGGEGSRENCTDTGQICVPGPGATGCRVCRPGSYRCTDTNAVEMCNADGTAYTQTMACDAASGQMCNAVSGTCASACQDAITANSYIGCEYWPTPAANFVSEDFDFAVVIANPQAMPANVTVTRNGSSVATATIPAGQLQTVRLPWVQEYKSTLDFDTGEPYSSLTRGGAYQLTSSLPVIPTMPIRR